MAAKKTSGLGGWTLDNAGAGPFQCTRAHIQIGFETAANSLGQQFSFTKRQTLIFRGYFLKKGHSKEKLPQQFTRSLWWTVLPL